MNTIIWGIERNKENLIKKADKSTKKEFNEMGERKLTNFGKSPPKKEYKKTFKEILNEVLEKKYKTV